VNVVNGTTTTTTTTRIINGRNSECDFKVAVLDNKINFCSCLVKS
jgi:hypothetical protein